MNAHVSRLGSVVRCAARGVTSRSHRSAAEEKSIMRFTPTVWPSPQSSSGKMSFHRVRWWKTRLRVSAATTTRSQTSTFHHQLLEEKKYLSAKFVFPNSKQHVQMKQSIPLFVSFLPEFENQFCQTRDSHQLSLRWAKPASTAQNYQASPLPWRGVSLCPTPKVHIFNESIRGGRRLARYLRNTDNALSLSPATLIISDLLSCLKNKNPKKQRQTLYSLGRMNAPRPWDTSRRAPFICPRS